ncbi:hypothetical protein GVN21_11700 [Caulobacter sp. SLTY]|uniref:hypothetical protein n=1 Tax=Caulobacter sp. SLTY TaxID=2683262 RepID=UPI001411DD07|nr:hypothetical protein [Caulobacter sp. SLTY]NBB16021.1 hypothetical protein [Caulobacter sp. SLTY]
MTVSAMSTRTVSYAGDGGSGPFPIPFRVLEAGDLRAAVIAEDGVRTPLEGISVADAGEPAGATVTTAAPISLGETLVLWTETTVVQAADYLAGDAFPAETHEAALDRLTLIAQDARRDISRAFKAPVGSPTPDDKTYETFVADAAAAVGSEAVELVMAAGDTQVGAVEAAGAAQVEVVGTAGDVQISRVEDEGDDQIAMTSAAGAGQVVAVNTAGDAKLALIAAARGGDLHASTSDGLSNGVINTVSLVGGFGGANGTFDLAFTGGGGTGAAGRFTVVGGTVTSITLTAKGRGYTSVPTISFAASGGLTGASATAIVGVNTNIGEYFSTPGTNGAALNVYRVDIGPVATLIGQLEAWQSKAHRYFFGQAQHDTAVGQGLRPYVEPYALRMYMGTLAGGAIKNANGTYTLPPNATWTSPQLSAGVFDIAGNRYAYVPTTAETTGAIEIRVYFGGTSIAAGNTTTQPNPDFYRQTWNNSFPRPYVQIEIKNVSASAVTVYPIEVYAADAAHFPQVMRFEGTANVPENRRVIEWNDVSPMARWRLRDRGMWVADEGRIAYAFDSVAGLDGATGGLFAPKQNITAGLAVAAGSVIGLKRGSRWNQSLSAIIGSTTKGLRVRDYQEGRVSDPWPILDSAIDVTGLAWASEGSNTYSATVPCATDLLSAGKLNYDYASVVEIELSRQADEPLGSQFIYEPVNIVLSGAVPAADQTVAINKVKAEAGRTLGLFTPGTSSYTLYIHTRDGLAPNASPTYRYRATNLGSCLDWIQGNTRQAAVQNIEICQGARGLGIICGSNQSVFDGIIAYHGYKHTLHIEGGEVRNFILYNRGAKSGIDTGANAGNCYVSPTASGFSWRWTNGIAYDCDSAIYSHAAAGKYTAGEISYVWTINSRDASGSLSLGDPRDSDQVAYVEEMWCFDQGKITNGNSGADYTHFHHCLARCIGRFQSRDLTEQCISQVVNISGAAIGDRGMRLLRVSGSDEVTRNIFYGTNEQTVVGDANPTNDYRAVCIELINTGGDPLGNPNIHRNIFLVDTPLCTGGSILVAEQAGGLTWQSDYNVFIFCTPGSISSTKFGQGTKATISEYLASFPGHDANSLFVDLRDDPRGSKAVFKDAANGDFTWAQTEVAARIKSYCVANSVGPEHSLRAWPVVPAVDDARRMLMATT